METLNKLENQTRQMLEALDAGRGITRLKWAVLDDNENASAADYDDSCWQEEKGGGSYLRGQGITWYRFIYTVPDTIAGISIEGTRILLSYLFFAPIDLYADGELLFSERAWMDFKSPEIVLEDHAVPGRKICIAARLDLRERSFWSLGFGMNMIPEKVIDIQFVLASFMDEIKFAYDVYPDKALIEGVIRSYSEYLDKTFDIEEICNGIPYFRNLLEPCRGFAKQHKVHMVGHAHIDMNWFWSMEETIDVIKRDFTTMCDIMDEYPDFRFSQSQCATYEIAEEKFPELFERMKRKVDDGKWDITASTWVEGDLNMSSGESIVRHILYSKEYIREKFGKDPHIMWCPDTFGHSANIPQILEKSGITNYFFLRCGPGFEDDENDNDISVREMQHIPLFWWKGIDGSRVLAVNMLYGRDVTLDSINKLASAMQKKFDVSTSMYVYGTGDHGGGPTRRDIKRIERLKEYPTTPDIFFSTTEDFYSKARAELAVRDSLPIKEGEMNFIFDGCYTTHADIKWYNRKCEAGLYICETLGALSFMTGGPYDRSMLLKAWRNTLFNQFHDILDGSGVPDTYEYSSVIAQEAIDIAKRLTSVFAGYISSKVGISEKGQPVICFNPIMADRSDVIVVHDIENKTFTHAVDSGGFSYDIQYSGDDVYISGVNLGGLSWKVLYLTEGDYKSESFGISEENGIFKVSSKFYNIEILRDSGEIISLYDKEQKGYVVRKKAIAWRNGNGSLNTLVLEYEEPTNMSSWCIGNIEKTIFLRKSSNAVILEDGPVYKKIRITHEISQSIINQEIVVYNNHRRIDFLNHVVWGETGDAKQSAPFLRVYFSPDVRAGQERYDVPFATLERSSNNREMPSLKWVDIADGNRGFLVISDSKHGYRAAGNLISLSLIRSGWLPDWASDKGEHNFAYSILPYDSTNEYVCNKEGGNIEYPVQAFAFDGGDGTLNEDFCFVRSDAANINISTLKPAEDGNGFILRLYETHGVKTNAVITFGFKPSEVYETDLMENIIGGATMMGNSIHCASKPYEIQTFRILF